MTPPSAASRQDGPRPPLAQRRVKSGQHRRASKIKICKSKIKNQKPKKTKTKDNNQNQKSEIENLK